MWWNDTICSQLLRNLATIARKNENIQNQRKCWVRSIFSAERRLLQGASDNLVKEMLVEDIEKYIDYFGMPSQLFKTLLTLVQPIIIKKYVVRESISPEMRLLITLIIQSRTLYSRLVKPFTDNTIYHIFFAKTN
ncbi:uncharacterized protein LOC105283908 isoform X2 [Ooceraea biroi]|uniref:uncharacterized protein LOC105283908 isoform X2 n=1 Tax=Ooceraea biroi TaxID=2015173 RepID=UPI000F099869|nr:uncharacterized protein LOC105283908 isoform X2 [Ooceraea biroi]